MEAPWRRWRRVTGGGSEEKVKDWYLKIMLMMIMRRKKKKRRREMSEVDEQGMIRDRTKRQRILVAVPSRRVIEANDGSESDGESLLRNGFSRSVVAS